MKLKLAIQLCKNMGVRYVSYRVKHEFEKRSGILKRRHPLDFKLGSQFFLSQWKEAVCKNYAILDPTLNIERKESEELKMKAERILAGDIPFFNAEWISLGKNYNWITNPSNGYLYDINKHWSEIPDLSVEAGDIKYVWEKSRFSWVLTLIRYDHHYNNDLAEFVLSEIDSWIEHNPINRGPNWRCSQEISLRIFNWYFALVYYQNHPALTENRWNRIVKVIYASLHHVYNHIDFSRIAVRNNHAITETLFLTLSEFLFPFIPETKLWSRRGRKWFEREIDYQVYDDGTFLQFSMNYHRVVVQLLTLGISISEHAGAPFSKTVYERAYKSLDFLYQCLQEENGWLPNYGSNDGALFFPWSDTNYRDYRPQLNSLHILLTGESLYDSDLYKEEAAWWNIPKSETYSFPIMKKFYGIKEYSTGGYTIIRDGSCFTLLRCGSHKDRPAQADNLHMDVWVDGKNILRDSGTYKYNTDSHHLDYFMGTVSHNTVLVDGKSQMLRGGRFIWYYWTQKVSSKIAETESEYVFNGNIKAYQFLSSNARLIRSVRKLKGEKVWIVTDEVVNLDGFKKEQIWHINDLQIEFIAKENDILVSKTRGMSYNSDYYGVINDGESISFSFDKKIETKIIVK
ncbi:heparinase II/III family protein [Sphingobacterium siyangense]|uniref:Heparinase II/III-like protein n=1 Tax=Sphingobacterium siyangense TaxID=459529 RepID=A0A562MJ53_9SPHI|nr:heparinase II/III-family protein [Sphingobacterium siyangense]TWI19965.1 heparinase II/III-like protein [Sphingobacterium siyangense]